MEITRLIIEPDGTEIFDTIEIEEFHESNQQKREYAYQTLDIIEWENTTITVDKANQLWNAYTAEGDIETAQALTTKIAAAKTTIRNMYPNEE